MKKITSSKQIAFENYDRNQGLPTLASDRSFGLLFGGIFLVLGSIRHFPDLFGAYLWYLLAVMLLGISFFKPHLLAPFKKCWLKLGEVLHRIMNPLLLGILFFGLLTPMAIMARIRGRDLLRIKYNSSLKSYWIIRNSDKNNTDLKNQF